MKWNGHPEFSEFSYGFALTHEFTGWTKLRAAPVFPSLLDEGTKGWDVKLDQPGLPLYVQFKRSRCINSGSGRERKLLKKHFPLDYEEKLPLRYYRFFFMESPSKQHELLLKLDSGQNRVFYAAPYFHEQDKFNSLWAAKGVIQNTAFVRPAEIGHLPRGRHSLAFHEDHPDHAWLCSEPRRIRLFRTDTLLESLDQQLSAQKAPVRSQAKEWPSSLRGTFEAGLRSYTSQMRELAERGEVVPSDLRPFELDAEYGSPREALMAAERRKARRTIPAPSFREAELTERRDIIAAAELAYLLFDAQLFIVQKSPA